MVECRNKTCKHWMGSHYRNCTKHRVEETVYTCPARLLAKKPKVTAEEQSEETMLSNDITNGKMLLKSERRMNLLIEALQERIDTLDKQILSETEMAHKAMNFKVRHNRMQLVKQHGFDVKVLKVMLIELRKEV